jgi:hypothetical protein
MTKTFRRIVPVTFPMRALARPLLDVFVTGDYFY